jgi:ABC-type uncharacterized transport system ATPase subunit
LDIQLTDAADLARIPMLQAKALPAELQKGALSFAISEGESGLKEIASILEQLIAAGVAVQNYAVERPTLEEAFLQLVGTKASSSKSVVAERN